MDDDRTEIEKTRAAWWAEHYKSGMTLDEAFGLNEQLVALFPMTREERERRAREMENVPEFVL